MSNAIDRWRSKASYSTCICSNVARYNDVFHYSMATSGKQSPKLEDAPRLANIANDWLYHY
jgi:hypothetical protein